MPVPGIFISHSHKDSAFCQRLFAYLTQQLPGVDIFYDEKGLHGGDDWLRIIPNAVLSHPYFIVILSPDSVVAPWVQEETLLAFREAVGRPERRIIPLNYRPCDARQLSPILANRQIVDGAGGDAAAFANVLAALQRPASDPVPDLPPQLAEGRDYAAQTHTAFVAQQWRNAVRLGRFAVGLPGNERDATLWGELGVALLRAGERDEGLRALDTALGINRSRNDLWREKALALAAAGQFDGGNGALAAWDMALVAIRAPEGKLDVLAEEYAALMHAQRLPKAAEIVEEALELAPHDAGWQGRKVDLRLLPLRQRFDEAMQKKQWRQAAQIAQEALTQAPASAAWRGASDQSQAAILNERAQFLPDSLRRLNFAIHAVGDIDVIIPPTCAVPAGPFTMGSDKRKDPQARDDELPQHTVTLAAYQIGMFPVTVAEYACAMRAGAAKAPGESGGVTWKTQLERLDHPVTCVSWQDAVAYAAWLATMTGQPWRLPTEAEWEKAARGNDGRSYPWGNQWDKARANTSDGGPGMTTPVGGYANRGDASLYGAHDLAGNVWEWCSSLYRDYPYNRDDGRENMSDSSNVRVLRGGSWLITPGDARAACRIRDAPGSFDAYGGFRLALAAAAGT